MPEDWTYDDAKALMETLPDDVNGVICGNDKHFSYFKLLKAASILSRPNSVFIGTNIDQQFPAGDGLVIPGLLIRCHHLLQVILNLNFDRNWMLC